MIRSTCRPAIFPASFVACRCESLKYAGTVTTALLTLRPRKLSAVSFILVSVWLETFVGLSFSPCEVCTQASPLSARTISNGTMLCRCFTSSNCRPISRFVP